MEGAPHASQKAREHPGVGKGRQPAAALVGGPPHCQTHKAHTTTRNNKHKQQ